MNVLDAANAAKKGKPADDDDHVALIMMKEELDVQAPLIYTQNCKFKGPTSAPPVTFSDKTHSPHVFVDISLHVASILGLVQHDSKPQGVPSKGILID